jgi:DNA mismatch endonuclease (patch repair protein)
MPSLRCSDVPLARLLLGCCEMARGRVKVLVSARMARIRSSGSRMEREFATHLRRAGIRFRKQYPVLGKPDFVVLEPRIAIFCDSRFWHGYQWGRQSARDFKVNAEFWVRKIEGNRQRDTFVNRELRNQGWTVLRFWEHQISRNPGRCVLRIWAVIGERQRVKH